MPDELCYTHKGRRALRSDGEPRSPEGIGSVPALRSSVSIEREEHSLPPVIEAYQVDRAIQDDWSTKRIGDARSTGIIAQRVVPEGHAIRAAERIDAIAGGSDIEDVIGKGGWVLC